MSEHRFDELVSGTFPAALRQATGAFWAGSGRVLLKVPAGIGTDRQPTGRVGRHVPRSERGHAVHRAEEFWIR